MGPGIAVLDPCREHFPDLWPPCGDQEPDQGHDQPTLVVEILSPSARGQDRGSRSTDNYQLAHLLDGAGS